jgi:flagellar biosynthesis protein FlhB
MTVPMSGAGKGKRPDPLKDLPIPPELRRDS